PDFDIDELTEDELELRCPSDERCRSARDTPYTTQAFTLASPGRRSPAGDQERCAVGSIQIERIGKRTDRVRIRTRSLTALERPDRFRGEACPLSELLLCQARRVAISPKQRGEGLATVSRRQTGPPFPRPDRVRRSQCGPTVGPMRVLEQPRR